MATGHSSMSPENRASQSFNQDHIDDLLAHYAGLSQGSHEGRGFPPLRSQAQEEVPDYTRGQESPRHFSAAANPYPPAPVRLETGGNIASTSWNDLRETAADQGSCIRWESVVGRLNGWAKVGVEGIRCVEPEPGQGH